MASANVYKQSVFDHRSILISFSVVDDGSLNVKKYTKLLNNIAQQFEVIKVHSLNNDEEDTVFKNIYFNFKRDYSNLERKWENFQLHHRAVGLMFIGEFKRGVDFQRLLKVYESQKEKGVGSVLESRLVLIYDESNEDLVCSIRRNLAWQEEMTSSSESEASRDRSEISDCKEEINYIKETLLQGDIIWYQKSQISGLDSGSSASLTDSISSNNSNPWKVSSHNSDSSTASPYVNSSTKIVSLVSEAVNDKCTTNHDDCKESRAIYAFLKSIYDKLFASLIARELTLMNRTEHNQLRSNTMESGSDSGSTMSLDDLDFNLTDPVDLDRKRFQEELRFSKSGKSRHYLGRLAKQTGDYAMSCGNHWQAYHYYQLSICYLKKYNNDQLWLAGAEEGLCCAWISFTFATNLHWFDSQLVDSLHSKCRQAFVTQAKLSQNPPQSSMEVGSPQGSSPSVDQMDFSFLKKFGFNDLFKNPPEIQNLDDLNEKYLAAISRYKKALKMIKCEGLQAISMDSCIKAGRFFIDRHRYLDASNFLKLIKADLTSLDKDMEKYHNTLSDFYSQMGFIRKSILHKYQTMVLLQNSIDNSNGTYAGKRKLSISNSSRQKLVDKKLSIINEILGNLNLNMGAMFSEDHNDRSVRLLDNGHDDQFESIKMKMVAELFSLSKGLKFSGNVVIGLGLSLLDNWYSLLTKTDCQRLVEDVNQLCKAEMLKGDTKSKVCYVKALPRLVKVVPSKLSNHLLPKVVDKSREVKSIFLYTPLAMTKRSNERTPLEPVVWVCGEECELVLQFDNMLPIHLQLSGVQFLFQGRDHQGWVLAEGSSVHTLPSRNRSIHCHFVVVPTQELIPLGEYRITSISYQISVLCNITFCPHNTVSDSVLTPLNTAPIKILPNMPQMRILTSLIDYTDGTLSPSISTTSTILPSNTVLSSNILVYDNELLEFSVFLSNESKDLDIDTICCDLDELTMSTVSSMLVSRVCDDEYNNRRLSSHRMLSLVQEDIMSTLSIKSMSSLKHSFSASSTSSDCPSLPTDAIVKFRLDITEKDFCKELFKTFTSNKSSSPSLVLWNGQFRITFRYWPSRDSEMINDKVSSHSDMDDMVVVRKTDKEAEYENMFRESVYVLNCQVVLGLCIINYRIERNLDLIVTLRNFTENKMNIDIYWKEAKINLNYIVIVPNCGQISQFVVDVPKLQRVSSTECSSHIINYRISSETMDFKTAMENGSIKSKEDLTEYIQRNLKISWIMKDKCLDKIRQGNVNMTQCVCVLNQHNLNFDFSNKLSMAHDLIFSENDLVKIWMWKNVTLAMSVFTQSYNSKSPVLPDPPTNDPLSTQILECVQFRLDCDLENNCTSNISDEVLGKIILKCTVTATRTLHISSSSSEEDNVSYQQYQLAGNTVLRFNRTSVGRISLSGVVLFLVPGSYTVHGQLMICGDQYCKVSDCARYDLLEESNKCEVFVT